MKTAISGPAIVAAALLACSPASGLQLNKRDGDRPPRVVGMDMQRRHVAEPHIRDKVRRQGGNTVQATLDNMQTLYFVNATIGTPPQKFRLHIDTGSSDLWVNSADSDLCSKRSDPCSVSGTYNANDSSTYNIVNSDFDISYADGSGASGDYVTDDFRFGSDGEVNVTDLQFGVGYDSSTPQGILGIGYPNNEVQVVRGNGKPYDNLPAKLVSDGLTASQAYSLYLNSLDSSTGSVLFGGVDTERYMGQLHSLPILRGNAKDGDSGKDKRDDAPTEFVLELTGLSSGDQSVVTSSKGFKLVDKESEDASGDDFSLPVLLDSGTSLSYLPVALVSPLFDAVNAVFSQEDGIAFVDCSLAKSSSGGGPPDNVTFTFTDPVITVPMSELVLDVSQVTDPSGGGGGGGGGSGGGGNGKIPRPRMPDGSDACLFGIAPAMSSKAPSVLGDTFLRSAYVVYDMDNNEVSLAQTRFDAVEAKSNVLEIQGGKNGVPDATGVAGAGSPDDDSLAPGKDLAAVIMAAVAGAVVGIAIFLM